MQNGFTELINGCIEECDYADGIDSLETMIALKLLDEMDTREEILRYFEKNRRLIKLYTEPVQQAIDYVEEFLRDESNDIDDLRAMLQMQDLFDDEDDSETVDDASEYMVSTDYSDEFVDLVNRAIESEGGVEDFISLSHSILEEFIKAKKTKGEIMDMLGAHQDSISMFKEPVAKAILVATHKVEIFSEEYIEELYRIITSD